MNTMTAPDKAPTGISGFDQITRGGLPRGHTTLLVGGPGSGKTIMALQFLVHGARSRKEPGVFVAFEESAERIIANASSFGWKLDKLRRVKGGIHFLDARPPLDVARSGDFDLSGMLSALGAQAARTGASRIVFDAIDILLSMLPDDASRRREMFRLHDWLVVNELTAIITAKADVDESQHSYSFMQFMVDCAVILNHSVVLGVSQRNLRVQKYRGTGFDENEAPFVIGTHGMDVAVPRALGNQDAKVTNERVSCGVERLDTMLGGGYYRGASVLITGFPGTAKTTLSGAFAEAACARGEHTAFFSFDSDGSEVIRNLASVNIRLRRYVKNGCLRMVSARTIAGSAETIFGRIKELTQEHGARCVVIDPLSILSQAGNEFTAHAVAERLMDWSKATGTTLLCTSLLDEASTETGSQLQISKMADTWIHLNYLVQAGERNRGMSIIKSRGTAHSNQVRELILSNSGVTVTDTYTAGGEVLMGTLRWEKESAERVAKDVGEVAGRLKRVRLDAEEAELVVRMKSLQVELEAKQVEKALLESSTKNREGELSEVRTRMRELRGADSSKPRR